MPKNPKFKTLRNKSPIAQMVIYQGASVVLDPFEERLVDAELGEKFLQDCSGLVIEISGDFGSEFQEQASGTIWVGNRTGNPDEPDEVNARIYDSKARRWLNVSVPNPIKGPRDLREHAEGAMQEYTAKDGVLEALNLPGHWVEVPAYRRRQMSQGEGNWFLTRTALAAQAANVPGYNCNAAVLSRAPSNFEPTSDWDMDETRLYLQLMDPDAILGPTEDELMTQTKAAGTDEFEWTRIVDNAKRTLMKRVYFRLIDTKYVLPTKARFNELQKAKAVQRANTSKATKSSASANA